jgi:MSHA biogenesis protein MshO
MMPAPTRGNAILRGPRRGTGGATLIELVVVMSVLGIIAAVAALALRDPISAYGLTARRAEMVDIADTALRRMGRDIRLALPNSLRIATSGATIYLELLTTRTGGRYRAQQDNTPVGDILNFSAADTAFDTLGPMSTVFGQTIVANDILVVQNLFAIAAQPQSNAYTYNQAASNCTTATPSSTTCNTARITGPDTAGALPNERHIGFDSRQFPLTSPGNRFNVVSGPVTYVCAPGAADANGNGTGTLTRISNYTIALAQPQPPAGTSALLAKYVTACQINYDQIVLTQNHGMVSMKLSITRGGETVTLYHEVHVDNVP